MRWSSGDYQIAPLPPQGGKGRCARWAQDIIACDAAERIIFAIVAGSGSGKLCWHSRRNDSGQENADCVGAQLCILRRYSALRKCRNAVSAGVLSPISSAVGRNGAVGDKESARAGARNYPRRRQIMRLRRCAATPHPSRLRRATCLPAGRSVRGSDTPPACHSTPRTPQGEG